MTFKHWEIANVNKDLAKQLAEECDIDPFVALIAASRGYTDPACLEEFLSEEGVLGDIYDLPDIALAADIINKSIENGETIAVYGDYDCDGVTATAIVYSYLLSRGVNAVYYIPNRIDEGYGMSKGGIDALKKQGVSLIITVDNGIACIDEVEYAKSLDIKVVITDHHIGGDKLPDALAVVDPHIKSSKCEFKDICGAVVAFKVVCAAEHAEPEEMIFNYGDLAAIGTIGDVMPLINENRTIVKYGIKNIAENSRPGLIELLKLSGADINSLDSSKVAFSVVPRLNAAGRMGSAERAFKLLICENEEEASLLAKEIFQENINRQQTEKEILLSAEKSIEENKLFLDRVIVVDGMGWHMGVIGIVASRICEEYARPAIVISNNNGMSCGSCRSIEGFSIYDAINECSAYLEKFGGHKQAAGITLKTEKIDSFRKAINDFALKKERVFKKIRLDCKLNPAALSVDLAESIKQLEPFGQANSVPMFAILGVTVERITPIGNNKHIKILFSKGNVSFQAVRFSVSEENFEFFIGDTVDLAVQIDVNIYNQKELLSVVIKDMRISGTDDTVQLKSLDLYNRFLKGNSADFSSLLPSREEFAVLYKYILKNKVSFNNICYHFAVNMPLGKIYVILKALKQLKLIEEENINNICFFKVLPQKEKVDLRSAPVIKDLESK